MHLMAKHMARGVQMYTKDVTTLMLASDYGNLDIVNMLMTVGADASLPTKNGITAMGYTAEEDHTEIIEILWKASFPT